MNGHQNDFTLHVTGNVCIVQYGVKFLLEIVLLEIFFAGTFFLQIVKKPAKI